MGKIHLKNFIIMIATILISLSIPLHAHAQECTSTIRNPAAAEAVTALLPYGVNRGGGHTHQGVDIMMRMCTPVQNQPDCKIILNGANSPLWKMGGLGFAARYKCSPRVEVRYGHLNTYNARTQMAIVGQSGAARGTGAHIHYEVYVYDRSGHDGFQVDPECVWGAHRDPSVCPSGLGIEPTDMCDDAKLDLLRANARSRAMDLHPTASSNAAAFRDGNIVDPSNVPLGDYPEDLPGCPDDPPTEDINTSHEGSHGDDTSTTDGTEIIPGTEGDYGDPDPIDPPAPIPGTPGGDTNLVPSPDPDYAPDKLSGCAADTWAAMINQAVMETRREDLLNKRFIVKSQSFLNYSCFGEQYKKTAELVAPIFSETEKWNNLDVDLIGKTTTIKLDVQEETNDPFFSEKDYNFWRDYEQSDGTTAPYKIFGPSSLDMAIDSVVAKALIPYLENNFNHGYLADSVPVSGADPTTCNVMSAVWKAAQCKNFDGADVFYTFEDLATKDPREFPVSMPCL